MALLLTCLAAAACSAIAAGAPVQAWLVPSTQKVFPTSQPPRAPARPALCLARGEYEAIQLAVRAPSTLSDCALAVRVSAPLRAEWLDVFQVAYVPTPADKKHKLTPDPLIPLQRRGGLYRFSVPGGQTTALWVRLHAPESAEPGNFELTVELYVAGAGAAGRGHSPSRAPIHRLVVPVTIWPFVLPRRTHIRTAFGISGSYVAQFHGIEVGTPEYEELYRKYYEELLRHRICAYHVPYGITDPRALKYLRSPRVNSFVVPYTEKGDALARTWQYLESVGVAHKAWIYPLDEPVSRKAYQELKRRAAFIKRAAPGLKICSPFYRGPDWDDKLTPFDELVGVLDIWCANTGYFSRKRIRELMRQRQAAGEEAWVYVCCGPGSPFCNFFVNMTALQHRMLAWQLYRYDLDGLLYWSTTYWRQTKDPYQDIATVKDISPKIYGDGSLLYPGAKFGIDGPVTSIRLECIRDGLEDYEYLVLAARALGADEAMKIAREATPDLIHYIRDPHRFEQFRRQLGERLAAAKASP